MTTVGVGVGPGFSRGRPPRLPRKVPGCEIWLCATDVLTGISDDIYEATDLSGNGRDHVQPTAANRPTLDSGLMVFDDSGTAQYLAGPFQSLLSNKPFAIFVLAELAGSAPDLLYGSLTVKPNNVGIFDDHIEYGGSTVSFARSAPMAMRVAWHDGTVYRYRHGGTELASATIPLTFLSTGPLGLGGAAIASGMRARSVVVYASQLTLAQVQQIEVWLQAECGS